MLYASLLGIAEQSETLGFRAPDVVDARYYFERCGVVFPFDQRFVKQAAYLDFKLVNAVAPVIGLSDIRRALEADPYSDDLLSADVLFHLRAGEMAEAEAGKARLKLIDPLYGPVWPD